MTTPDAELVERTRRGDADAFAALVAKYRDALCGVAYQRVGESAAEDLAQEAFVQAYTRLAQLRDPTRFGPWLFVIATNLCRQWARQHQAEPTAPPASCRTVSDPAASYATRDLVRRALLRLPAPNALAVVLYYVNGYSYEEIASFVDVPTTTIKGRLERGRCQLREELMDMEDALREEMEAQRPSAEFDARLLERITADEVWGLDAEAQEEHFRHSFLIIDGELAQRTVYGGPCSTMVHAPVKVGSAGDEPIAIYASCARPNRLYVFGRVELWPGGREVENTVIEVEASVSAVGDRPAKAEPAWPPDVSSAQVWALPPEEQAAYFRELCPNVVILLDGWIADACLVNGDPGSSTGTPEGQVRFRNVGDRRLSIYRYRWPRRGYYVFGEAEVEPFGLRATNTVVAFEPHIADRAGRGSR